MQPCAHATNQTDNMTDRKSPERTGGESPQAWLRVLDADRGLDAHTGTRGTTSRCLAIISVWYDLASAAEDVRRGGAECAATRRRAAAATPRGHTSNLKRGESRWCSPACASEGGNWPRMIRYDTTPQQRNTLHCATGAVLACPRGTALLCHTGTAPGIIVRLRSSVSGQGCSTPLHKAVGIRSDRAGGTVSPPYPTMAHLNCSGGRCASSGCADALQRELARPAPILHTPRGTPGVLQGYSRGTPGVLHGVLHGDSLGPRPYAQVEEAAPVVEATPGLHFARGTGPRPQAAHTGTTTKCTGRHIRTLQRVLTWGRVTSHPPARRAV